MVVLNPDNLDAIAAFYEPGLIRTHFLEDDFEDGGFPAFLLADDCDVHFCQPSILNVARAA